MPNTYVALATQTLGSNTATITFSSIPATYTDLVLVTQSRNDAPFQYDDIWICFNSDTTNSNYSVTRLSGDGTSATSNRSTAATDAAGTRSWILSDNDAGAGIFGVGVTSIMNYANATTYKTGISRSNTFANESVRAAVGLWRNTAAINSIKLSIRNETTSFIAGCTFTLYGIANADQGSAKATGGMITEDSTYWYHTFTSSGAFVPKQSLTCDVLVVAGGGGTTGQAGGGGGAGGLLVQTGRSVSVATYNITVGAGGPGSANNNTNGSVGSNSVFDTSTALGGGFGGSANTTATGGSGGSGGGGAYSATAGGTTTQGNSGGATGYGFAGAAGGSNNGAGGGGGAGAAGTAGASNGGAGGVGRTDSLINAIGAATGAGQLSSGNYYFSGGGGGGVVSGTIGAGGLGGGGDGGNYNTSSPNGTAGLVNTGGGGGGRGTAGAGFAGGSGVVVIRYSK